MKHLARHFKVSRFLRRSPRFPWTPIHSLRFAGSAPADFTAAGKEDTVALICACCPAASVTRVGGTCTKSSSGESASSRNSVPLMTALFSIYFPPERSHRRHRIYERPSLLDSSRTSPLPHVMGKDPVWFICREIFCTSMRIPAGQKNRTECGIFLQTLSVSPRREGSIPACTRAMPPCAHVSFGKKRALRLLESSCAAG